MYTLTQYLITSCHLLRSGKGFLVVGSKLDGAPETDFSLFARCMFKYK